MKCAQCGLEFEPENTEEHEDLCSVECVEKYWNGGTKDGE